MAGNHQYGVWSATAKCFVHHLPLYDTKEEARNALIDFVKKIRGNGQTYAIKVIGH